MLAALVVRMATIFTVLYVSPCRSYGPNKQNGYVTPAISAISIAKRNDMVA